jgi:hypothetical protein
MDAPDDNGQTYVLVTLRTGERGILCRVCGMLSWNLGDVQHTFCAKCDRFHSDIVRAIMEPGGVRTVWSVNPDRRRHA